MSASRWAKLGALTTKLAGSVVSETLADAVRSPVERLRAHKRAQQRRAEALVAELGKLKGAAMKMGQQLAVAARHLDLPQEVRATLDTLHKDAEPVDFDVVQATVERELGGPLESHFAAFDPTPLGTASLAQAHAATLPDGTEVVVKVLHPGIDDSVQADLLAMKTLLMGGRVLGRPRDEVQALMDELQERLLEELDYAQEAANAAQFADAFEGDPRFRVPRPHLALCTNRVLTLDRLVGQPIDVFVEHASDEVRNRAGCNLADLFFESTFRHRLLHADPHPGNFLFEDDGRLGVMDFGCVKRFDAAWIGTYARLVTAALDGNAEEIWDATRALGAWVGDDPDAGAVIVDFCEAVVEPLRDGPHTIGGPNDAMLARVSPVTQRMWRFPEIRGPRHLLFLHRTLGGLYTLAQRLVVTDEWTQRMRPHLQHAIEHSAVIP